MDINWKNISMNDQDIINSYYNKEPVRNCEFTFCNNVLWAPFYGIQYGIVENMLTFISNEAERSVSFPLGDGDLAKTLDILMEYFKEKQHPFRMHLISPEQFERLEALYPGRFAVEYNRDNADYVYETERLITLAGKKLHGKRNHVNRFKQNYPNWSYEEITEDNIEECRELAREWKKENDCELKGEKHNEFCVTMHALQNRKKLHLQGGLIRNGERVVAFALGEPCGDDMFVVHIEKAYGDVQGAYQMINQQFAQHEAAGFRYINREDDTGAEGLRKTKLSYYPDFMMEKGVVAEKGTT